jgi:hypothetical protein
MVMLKKVDPATSLATYFDKWVETATDGKVWVEYAVGTPRIRFHCKTCYCSLTIPTPTDINVIDYSTQEFVKIHGHKGGHNDTGWSKTASGTLSVYPGKIIEVEPTPVTADFKKVGSLEIKNGRRFR